MRWDGSSSPRSFWAPTSSRSWRASVSAASSTRSTTYTPPRRARERPSSRRCEIARARALARSQCCRGHQPPLSLVRPSLPRAPAPALAAAQVTMPARPTPGRVLLSFAERGEVGIMITSSQPGWASASVARYTTASHQSSRLGCTSPPPPVPSPPPPPVTTAANGAVAAANTQPSAALQPLPQAAALLDAPEPVPAVEQGAQNHLAQGQLGLPRSGSASDMPTVARSQRQDALCHIQIIGHDNFSRASAGPPRPKCSSPAVRVLAHHCTPSRSRTTPPRCRPRRHSRSHRTREARTDRVCAAQCAAPAAADMVPTAFQDVQPVGR
jgi:hypothetical protein